MELIVRTTAGQVEGTAAAHGTYAFRSIPFADLVAVGLTGGAGPEALDDDERLLREGIA